MSFQPLEWTDLSLNSVDLNLSLPYIPQVLVPWFLIPISATMQPEL